LRKADNPNPKELCNILDKSMATRTAEGDRLDLPTTTEQALAELNVKQDDLLKASDREDVQIIKQIVRVVRLYKAYKGNTGVPTETGQRGKHEGPRLFWETAFGKAKGDLDNLVKDGQITKENMEVALQNKPDMVKTMLGLAGPAAEAEDSVYSKLLPARTQIFKDEAQSKLYKIALVVNLLRWENNEFQMGWAVTKNGDNVFDKMMKELDADAGEVKLEQLLPPERASGEQQGEAFSGAQSATASPGERR